MSSSGSKESKDKKKNNTVSKNSKIGTAERLANRSKSGSGKKNYNVADLKYQASKTTIKNAISWMSQTQNDAGGLLNYFKQAPIEKSPPDSMKTYAFQANRPKNRNLDFPLYDHSRVRLKIEKESDNNYINATYVQLPQCDKKWIVSQHPMDQYIEDFWKMVFYEEIDTIYAIFSPDEQLPAYFPNEAGKFVNHGDFFVHCWKTTPPAGKHLPTNYIIEVLPAGCSNARYTTLLHYPYWPKGLVAPNPKVVLKGILETNKTEKVGKKKCLVHSAEGVNRAMTFLLVDCILDQMFRNIPVDIPEIVAQLRRQRNGAFDNRLYCIYSLFVVIEYVKLRLVKFKTSSELLGEIDILQKEMKKEFAGQMGKEPKQGGTIDTTIE